MQRKLLKNQVRRIASPYLGLAVLSSFLLAAENAGPRLSSPTLGWVLSAGGSQVTEIAGIVESPRTGSVIPLPVQAQNIWPAPDAHAALLQAGNALYLLRAGAELEQVAELPPGAVVTAAWDRGSADVAACWEAGCRVVGGPAQWEVPAGSQILAYSATAGLLTVSGEETVWTRANGAVTWNGRPAAAAFRPGTAELWVAGDTGGLTIWTEGGRQERETEIVRDPVGLAMAADGSAMLLVGASGAAAIIRPGSAEVEYMEVGETVEGAWPVPGAFAVRLHDSAKRAIAIWNAGTGTTAWAPVAVAAEVRQ